MSIDRYEIHTFCKNFNILLRNPKSKSYYFVHFHMLVLYVK